MAHADLVREALDSEAMSFLGWTWFPEALPREWPHGALKNGTLQPHARAQAFLSTPHRDSFIRVTSSDDARVRAIASVGPSGAPAVTGGNFSQSPVQVRFSMTNGSRMQSAEVYSEQGERGVRPSSNGVLDLPPLSLFRVNA